jgi:hypothetical protein
LLGALFLLASVSVSSAVAGQGELYGQFLGSAWGNKANARAGDLATRLGRSAYVSCPCNGTNGAVRSNSVNDVDGGDRYSAGKIVTTAQADKTADMRAVAKTTSRVTNISALGGAITADSMYAVANVRANATSILVNPEGSAITGLRVNGHAQQVDPGEQINIPGFGYAKFFIVSRWGNGETTRAIRVDMMRIVITRENSLDIPVGSVITVAHATVGYTRRETPSVVSAAAWGSQANSSNDQLVSAFGRSAAVYLGCFTAGRYTGNNHVESTSLPGTFSATTIRSHVYGEVGANLALARATARLEDVNLLDGLLTADVIKGVASARVDNSGGDASFVGSRFVNLEVNGEALPMGDNVPPNTQVAVPGLGTLTLFATTRSEDANEAHASVFMVILKVTAANDLGLPVGSEIKLARARADSSP